jgi:hypothetical protein
MAEAAARALGLDLAALIDFDAGGGVLLLSQPDRGHEADAARVDYCNPRQRCSPPRFPVYHRNVLLSPSSTATRGR